MTFTAALAGLILSSSTVDIERGDVICNGERSAQELTHAVRAGDSRQLSWLIPGACTVLAEASGPHEVIGSLGDLVAFNMPLDLRERTRFLVPRDVVRAMQELRNAALTDDAIKHQRYLGAESRVTDSGTDQPDPVLKIVNLLAE